MVTIHSFISLKFYYIIYTLKSVGSVMELKTDYLNDVEKYSMMLKMSQVFKITYTLYIRTCTT